MDILDFTRNDLGRIRHLQPEGWNDIVPEFEYYIRKSFCFPIKVTIGERIAGIGVAIALGSTGWLAHIIVDPAERKKGLGTLIVNELIHILRGHGVSTVLLIATVFHGMDFAAKRTGMIIQTYPYTYSEEQLA